MGRPWFIVPVAILIVIVVVLAGAALFTKYVTVTPPAQAGPGHGVRLDLCDASNGSFCGGNQLDLPRTYHGAIYNTSGCGTVVGSGRGETLWVNYTASGEVDGLLLPSATVGGPTGWFVDPVGLLHNATALHASAWTALNRSGAVSAAISVPFDGQTWCLSWYAPGSSVSIGWASDVVVTYLAP